MRTISRDRAVTIAEGWWSVMTWNDPGVCMYAFGSTGKVQSEEHRGKLLHYIDVDCRLVPQGDDPGYRAPQKDMRELRSLRRYIENAPIETA
jgi:hypothetical protein